MNTLQNLRISYIYIYIYIYIYVYIYMHIYVYITWASSSPFLQPDTTILQERDSSPQPLSSWTNTQPFSKTGLNDWTALWVIISTFHLTVWYYHVTNPYQSESTFFSVLNSKELLARNRRVIWSFCDSSQMLKLASFAKLLNVCLQTKWLWLRNPLLSLKFRITRL